MRNHTINYTLMCLLCSLFLASCLRTEKVDLIVHNATIYTVDELFSMQQAMAIKDGKIVAIGPEREILNKYSGTEKLDAAGKPVYPGFIDAHCHFLVYGLGIREVDLVGTHSFDEVIERIVEFARKDSSGWITGRGWDQNDWAEQAYPDNAVLDSLFPERPVLIHRIDGHAALANSEAMKRANITSKTSLVGGSIGIQDGRLTGILIDNAVDMVEDVIPEPDEEQQVQALLEAQEKCFAAGLTTVDDAGLEKEDVELIDRLQSGGRLKMRIYAMLTANEKNFEHYLIAGPFKSERLNVRSFKFYGDGALGSRGACLLEPYSDIIEQEHFGFLTKDPEYYKGYAQKLYDMGFQMNTHCIGDSANRLMLQLYGQVLGGTNDKRWRIEHAQVVNPRDIGLFREFNIIPSVQPTHCTSDMYWAGERLGPERLKGAYAYRELLEQNGMIALGTDFPVESIEPLGTFFAAVARTDKKGWPGGGFQPENALTREQALRGMTIGAAIANFEENEKGSLEAGKYADFVILNMDIMTVPLDRINTIKVIGTFINGEQVYSNKN